MPRWPIDLDALDDVAGLGLGGLDERLVARRRVGPLQHEEVREPGHGHGAVAAGTVRPRLVQGHAVATRDRHGTHEALGVEAGGEDQHVELVDGAVGGLDALGHDADDVVGHHVDGVTLDLAVEAAGDDQALAQRVVGGGQLLAQLGVPHRAQAAADHRPDQPTSPAGAGRGLAHGLLEHPLPAAVGGAPQAGDHPVQGPSQRRVRQVGQAEHPVGRAHVEVEPLGHAGQGRGDLDAGRTGPDHADALTVEADVVVPARRVEARPAEVVQSRDVGNLGVTQHAGGRDQDVELVLGPVVQGDAPHGIVPRGVLHAGAEADEPAQVQVVDDVVEVVEDLRRRVRTRGSIPGTARTRTSSTGTARRSTAPGRCCPATCHRRAARPRTR